MFLQQSEWLSRMALASTTGCTRATLVIHTNWYFLVRPSSLVLLLFIVVHDSSMVNLDGTLSPKQSQSFHTMSSLTQEPHMFPML
jgi:hypothetical protein